MKTSNHQRSDWKKETNQKRSIREGQGGTRRGLVSSGHGEADSRPAVSRGISLPLTDGREEPLAGRAQRDQLEADVAEGHGSLASDARERG